MTGSEVYMEQVLQCDDSVEGVFTGIYEAYARKYKLDNVRIITGDEDELRLFANYERIITDVEKSGKVARTIRRLAGEAVYEQIYLALASVDKDKAQAVYKTVEQIVKYPERAYGVMDRLADSNIHKAFTLFRNVRNEVSSFKEFIRFHELNNGVLYARIAPKNDVVSFLMPHFADRFPLENFMIYDVGRKLLGIRPAKSDWYLIRDVKVDDEQIELSATEEKYRELFCHFCHKIAIEERENLALQCSHLPKKYRAYMVEFTQYVKTF